MDKATGCHFLVFAVIDTEGGEKLMNLAKEADGELYIPIEHNFFRLLHFESYMRAYAHHNVIHI